MRSRWVVRIFGIAIFLLIVIAGFGQAVLQLWNLLMPDIFGLHPISFWQAVGLMGLSWILFGGLGMFRGRPLYATLAAPHGGAPGADVSRRAREVSPGVWEALRVERNAPGRPESVTVYRNMRIWAAMCCRKLCTNGAPFCSRLSFVM